MKQKLLLVLLLLITIIKGYSQILKPSFTDYFSWKDRFGSEVVYDNYISPAKDQYVQGPCAAFAGVGGLEAVIQIYFNKTINQYEMDLSEQHIYSSCNPEAGVWSLPFWDAIDFIVSEGIVEEDCFPYPTQSGLPDGDYYGNCDSMGNCSEDAYFPGYDVYYNITNNNILKKLIIERGPIMVYLPYNALNGSLSNHSLLVIGWEKVSGIQNWILKDSWPGNPRIYSTSYDILNYDSHNSDKIFVASKLVNGQDKISCNTFSENDRSWTDGDEDGFYYWGIGDKPSGCPGPCEMDFNDADPTTIFLDDDNILRLTPELDCPDYACTAGSTFRLTNIPPGFSVSWSVSPSTYFNSPTSGTDSVTVISPKTMYTGSEGTITFTISDGCSSLYYTKTFTINMPEPEEISIDVVPSNAPDPIYFSEVWLLCPNSSYYIYLNNNSGCSTTNYQWSIPSQWTKYEQTNNYIRINTNNTPSTVVTITATTCCNTSHLIKTQYFGQSYSCGGYLLAYPNPATEEFTIEFDDTFDLTSVDSETTLEIYDLSFSKKYKAEKIDKQIKVKTSGWKEGFYYIILTHKAQKYYEKIKIGN